MKKRDIIIALCFMGSLALIILVLLFRLFNNFKHIEDTNGNLTSLETIDLSNIEVINKTKYIETFSSSTYTGNKSGVVNQLKDVDYDYLKFQSKKFSGVKVVQSTKVENNHQLIIEINSELKDGNLEIIVLAPNNQIIRTEVNAKKQIVINQTIAGIYKVIVGGESADYKIEITRIKN